MGQSAIREVPISEFLILCRRAQDRPAIKFGVKPNTISKNAYRFIEYAAVITTLRLLRTRAIYGRSQRNFRSERYPHERSGSDFSSDLVPAVLFLRCHPIRLILTGTGRDQEI